MNILIMKLIYHDYSNDEITKKCSPTKLTIENEQVVESSELQPQVIECIRKSHLAIAYRHEETHKDYGYIFFFVKKIEEQETLYIIDNIILDEALEVKSTRSFIQYALLWLLNTIKDSDIRKDRIKTTNPGSYLFCNRVKDETIKKVCNDIISLWEQKTKGYTGNQKFMKKIGEEGKRYNNFNNINL